MKAWGQGIFVCAVVGLLLLPTAAVGKSGYFLFPGSRESSLSLKGTHGYRIVVSSSDRGVELSASNGKGVAYYAVKARRPYREGIIKATFPLLGRVAVRFHPSGKPQHIPPFPHCHGGRTTIQRGVFRGTIEFQGEEGFTNAHTTQARGKLTSISREVCPRSDHDPSTDIAVGTNPTPGYSLSAVANSPGRQLAFSAFRSTSDSALGGNTWFSAFLLERRGGMRVIRVAFDHANLEDFAVGGDKRRPDSASVTPSLPFRGTAAFQADAGVTTWAGPLTVDLPGAPDLQLTGPSFRSSLCLNKRCVGAPRH
jgi:hypothetical protein